MKPIQSNTVQSLYLFKPQSHWRFFGPAVLMYKKNREAARIFKLYNFIPRFKKIALGQHYDFSPQHLTESVKNLKAILMESECNLNSIVTTWT